VDTRTKIVPVEAACELAGAVPPPVLVTGYFDVLLSADIHDLRGVRDRFPDAPLVVALSTPPDPLMPLGASAEMVAALAMVDYVVSPGNKRLDSLLRAFPAGRTVRLEALQRLRMRELTEHVRRRQSR
jgi:hypothetical protein